MKIKLLKWQPHPTKENGWYGVTATGFIACYVYQPVDMSRKGPLPWLMWSYFGGKDHPLPSRSNARRAKLDAQKWWRNNMTQMITQ